MRRDNNDECPICSSDQCPQCGADMAREELAPVPAYVPIAEAYQLGQQCEHGSLARSCQVCELTRQRDAAVAEYIGIVDAIDALGCPDDAATVDWVESLVRERDELRAKLDNERIRLAACGVAAMSNTERTAAMRLTKDSPAWSASYGDVCAAVDREMALRAKLAEACARAADLVAERDELRARLADTDRRDCLDCSLAS